MEVFPFFKSSKFQYFLIKLNMVQISSSTTTVHQNT